MEANRMYFDKEAIKNGELTRLLEYLMQYSYGENGEFYQRLDGTFVDHRFNVDIRVYPADCEAWIVEWYQVPVNRENYGGEYKFIEDDQYVMREYQFPDKHYDYFESDEDFEEVLKMWLEENPGWCKHDIMNIWVKNDDSKDKEK